jgi:hypothetical protein
MTSSDFAIIVTIESETYEDGLREAEAIAEGLGQEGINASAVVNYERRFTDLPAGLEHERIVRLHGVFEFDESGHRYPAGDPS